MKLLNYAFLLFSMAALLGAPARAQSGEESDELRYEFFIDKKEVIRFDKVTGKAHRLIKTADGITAVEIPMTFSKKAPVTDERVGAERINRPSEHNSAVIGERPKTKPKKPFIDIVGPDGKPIPETLTDADRKAALADIVSYEKDLATHCLVRAGDRLSGAFMVKNRGNKRIHKMEVTLLVPVNGKEKPEEYHFLFVDSDPVARPPQPSENGREGASSVQNVDLPSPGGGIKGNCEIRVTYIEFAE